MKNIRRDIIDSYEKLIHDCEVQIKKGLDIQKNEFLIGEYLNVLKQVENKTEEEYEELTEQIEKIYKFSTVVHEYLSPIHPKRNIKYNRNESTEEDIQWLNLDLSMQ